MNIIISFLGYGNGRLALYATPAMHDGRSRHIPFEH